MGGGGVKYISHLHLFRLAITTVVTVPCQYGSDSGKPPYDCNPSCGGSASRGEKNWWGGGKAY